jgi:hypothetical protein
MTQLAYHERYAQAKSHVRLFLRVPRGAKHRDFISPWHNVLLCPLDTVNNHLPEGFLFRFESSLRVYTISISLLNQYLSFCSQSNGCQHTDVLTVMNEGGGDCAVPVTQFSASSSSWLCSIHLQVGDRFVGLFAPLLSHVFVCVIDSSVEKRPRESRFSLWSAVRSWLDETTR